MNLFKSDIITKRFSLYIVTVLQRKILLRKEWTNFRNIWNLWKQNILLVYKLKPESSLLTTTQKLKAGFNICQSKTISSNIKFLKNKKHWFFGLSFT